jgi:hypothetical protein
MLVSWKEPSTALGVKWGTKGKPGCQQAEVTCEDQTQLWSTISCRPLELLNNMPAPLPMHLNEVFIVMIMSNLILGSHQNAQKKRIPSDLLC